MNLENVLEHLNDEQRQAVKHQGTPLLILAGAGAGKTKVITTKIAYLIANGVPPFKILAVTFTNKAAREMYERATALVSESSQSSIKTFHAFGAWFLRKFYAANDLAQNFSIYDDSDSATLLGTCFPGTDKQTIKKWQRKISRAKDDFIFPEDITVNSPYADIKVQYAAYQKKLRDTGNADFGDLIMLPAQCLKTNADIKKHVHNFFSVILVDEFQDTNIAQMELLKELTSEKTYLCVVGDDDQSIYKFRGASVSNILSFQHTFAHTQIIKLEKNYRSTPQILNVANSIIKHNDGRLGKTLQATRSAGIKPILFVEANQTMEAERVIELIYNDVQRNKKKYSDWAILYRTNYQSRNFETAFLKDHIPYKVVGSLKFYEREEIKDSIAFLRFTVNIKDEVSFRRIINKPLRGIGPVSQDKILAAMNRSFAPSSHEPEPHEALALNFEKTDSEHLAGNNVGAVDDVFDDTVLQHRILTNIAATSLSKKIKREAERFFTTVFSLRKMLTEKKFDAALGDEKSMLQFSSGLSQFVAAALIISKLADYHKSQDEISDSQKLSNLQELVTMAVSFELSTEGLSSFLETLSLDASTTDDETVTDAVTLITVHGTKGLEFPNVVITGLEENIFPITKSGEEADIEEERRLMYVACTRAKQTLFMTAVENRMWAGRFSHMDLSRFIDEIDPALITVRNYADSAAPSFSKLKKTGLSFPKMIPSAAKKAPSETETKWKKGVIVYSDDSGFGKIISSDIISGEHVIEVRFESGERKVFLPAYNVASLEIVDAPEGGYGF